jgi:type II secretory pathway pseudopilin PulG
MRIQPVLFKRGFTLIEVLVFVSVFSIALVTILAGVIYSSAAFQDAKIKIIATHYNEELAEWVKYQKELNGYDSIYNKISEPTWTSDFCFNQLDIENWPSVGDCLDNYSLDNVFKRELTISRRSVDELSIEIKTYWKILNNTKESNINFYINNF